MDGCRIRLEILNIEKFGIILILIPSAYWVLVAHSTDHAESAKTLDQVAIGSFAIGGILLLLDGMINPL